MKYQVRLVFLVIALRMDLYYLVVKMQMISCIIRYIIFLLVGFFQNIFYRILFIFTEKNTWTEMKCSGTIPSPRYNQAHCIFENTIFIYGGQTEDGESNELYTLNLGNKIIFTQKLFYKE